MSVLFFTSKPLLVLVISRPKKLTVSPSWRNTTKSVKYRLVFMCPTKIAYEMFIWSRAHHVIHVTQKIESSDRGVRFFTYVDGTDINGLQLVSLISVCCAYTRPEEKS